MGGLKAVDGFRPPMPLPGVMTSLPPPSIDSGGRLLCGAGRALLAWRGPVQTSGMHAWAPRMLAVPAGMLAAMWTGACDPTVIIGVGGSQADAQGSGPGGAQGDATLDAQRDATGDATVGEADGAPSDASTDAPGDASTCVGSTSDAAIAADPDASVGPWTTGFETGFCDYGPPMGFCYTAGPAAYFLVTSPVHSGKYAAAFTMQGVGDASVGPGQARCVEQGVFPTAAYYGAWYYVPASAVNSGTWNLFHFQGGAPGSTLRSLWDVSLVNMGTGGDLHIVLYDFLNGMAPNAAPAIPIDQWFHIEVYFKRAQDATGTITLFQDGVMAANLTGLVTDPTDWGQWYVGNFADSLVPPSSTVYVDDVTVGLTP